MLVLYLVLTVFRDFKICAVVRFFLFHFFQRFATIVDTFLGILRKLFKFFWLLSMHFVFLC